MGDKTDRPALLRMLNQLEWDQLSPEQRLSLLRAYQLTFIRLGKPADKAMVQTTKRLDRLYPADSYHLNRELSQLLIYLQAPSALPKTLDLLTKGRNQQEQIHFALVLRLIPAGWTLEQRQTYFRWFNHAASYIGGKGVANNPAKSDRIFKQVLKQIRADAIKTLTDKDKTALKPILDGEGAAFKPKVVLPASGGKFVKQWKVEDLLGDAKTLNGRNHAKGRSMYTAAACNKCHQFAGEGTPFGPDLSGVIARFDRRTLLESILEPSKVVSDQFQARTILTKDGQAHIGIRIGQTPQQIILRTAAKEFGIDKKQITSQSVTKVSLMPPGLLFTLNKEEVLDLLAYLISRGDPTDPVFKK
jgi:putative heme-binding domain-containing protein